MIIVSGNNDGDYTSIQDAVDNAKEGDTIFIKEGIYKERVTVKTRGLTIIGSNSDFRSSKVINSRDISRVNDHLESDRTIITYGLYANMPSEDIGKLGTFRTYTMFIDADNVTLKDMTIENSAGAGPDIGQAIALYAEGNDLDFENVRLLGWQDTLFTGPLPEKEIEKNGFIGPKQFAPRINGVQHYKNCHIEGDIDFIFGSATAYFDNCLIFQKDRSGLLKRRYGGKAPEELKTLIEQDEARETKGYATAASTPKDQEYGYIFTNCRFESDCPDSSCYLGRPWRNHAAVAILHSYLGPHIKAEGFHNWNKKEAEKTVRFYEFENFGPGSVTPSDRKRFMVKEKNISF
ncbi:pectin methylesterase [Lachnospiraceae bacterium JC7]|nr:pectin methylesterase [Lachnospiraceae bacterium JC7]